MDKNRNFHEVIVIEGLLIAFNLDNDAIELLCSSPFTHTKCYSNCGVSLACLNSSTNTCRELLSRNEISIGVCVRNKLLLIGP